MKMHLKDIYDRAKQRPDIDVKQFLSEGTLTGDVFTMDDTIFHKWLSNHSSGSRNAPDTACCGRTAVVRQTAPRVLPVRHTVTGSIVMPSLVQRAKNFGKSMVTVASASLAGTNIKADAVTIEQRLSICNGCDKFIKDKALCSVCGCNLHFKTRLTSMHCPLNPPKW